MRAVMLLSGLLAALALPPARAGAAEAQGVMAQVHAGHWVQADIAAAALPDPLARKLVAFYRMLAPYAASVDDIDAFRAANPAWPLQSLLVRRREEAILAEPDDATAAAACRRLMPSGSRALLRCADGFARLGDADAAAAAARASWIAASPDPRWEAAFLGRYGPTLRPADQWRRFERLAAASAAAAGSQVPRLDPADQARAEARLAFARGDPQAAALLAALPAAGQVRPEMLLAHAGWLRRTGQNAAAVALWRQSGAAAERAAAPDERPAFWNERNRLARELLTRGDAADAYALAAGAAQTAPAEQADAAFLAGWIALRRLSDPARAAAQFAVVAKVSRAVITQARAHYWLARAAAASGDGAAAQAEYRAAAAFPSTYYGQLAALASGAAPAQLASRIVADRDPAWTSAEAQHFATGELARAATWLVAWGEPGRAAAFLLQLDETAPGGQQRALAARLATGFDMPQTAVALARIAGREGDTLLDTGWPVAAEVPRGGAVDAALVLGIIRQESSFDPAIVSPAGARGLMQLLPATAAQQARRLGVPESVRGLTADPALNVRLGTAYLAGLLARFAGATPLAAAGYNAGPMRVVAWLAANGDPRTPAGSPGSVSMQDWIELIPFSETRNYVQRVIENMVIYQAKLGEAAPYPIPWRNSPA